MRFTIALLAASFLIGRGSVLAQDGGSVEMYPNNYVLGILEEQKTQRSRAVQRVHPNVDLPLNVPFEMMEPKAASKGDPREAVRRAVPAGEERRILALAVIANGEDQNHMRESLRTLVEIASRHRIPLGTSISVGGFSHVRNSIPSEWAALSLGGGKIALRAKVPTEYPVLRSPAWIVRIEEGIVLLEGVDLARHVNSRGALVNLDTPERNQELADQGGSE